MPGRTLPTSGGYRYGFNGKEEDDEVKGNGNQQGYGMRIYDPRVGKFLSVDPLTKKYPELTPYQFASNRPIDGKDLDGLEYVSFWEDPLFWVAHFGEGFFKGEGTAYDMAESFNRNINPYGIIAYGTYGSVTGRDLTRQASVDRLSSGTNMAANLMLLWSGQELTKAMAGATTLESQMIKYEQKTVTSYEIIANAEVNACKFGEQWGTGASYSASNKTTTVLGNAKGYLSEFLKNIENKVANDANSGGYSYLKSSSPYDFSTIDGRNAFWNDVNKPFLDKAIERGDRIVLTDNPYDPKALFYDGDSKNGLNFFGREIEYLFEKGFTFVNGEALPPNKTP